MSLYLTHYSCLLSKRKDYYHRLTDAGSTGAMQYRKFELLQFNANTTCSEETEPYNRITILYIYIYTDGYRGFFSQGEAMSSLSQCLKNRITLHFTKSIW